MAGCPDRSHNQGAAQNPHALNRMSTEPFGKRNVDEEEEDEEEDTYVSPEGQGCFSFRQSLLFRAKDTYAARCAGNKYEIISQWLLTGLAVVLSRPNWQILAKKGTLTSTLTPALLSTGIPGWPHRQSQTALRASVAQCHVGWSVAAHS